jgi:hypothetical protein
MCKRNDDTERTEKKHASRGNDHSTQLALGIEADVLLIGNFIGEQNLIWR